MIEIKEGRTGAYRATVDMENGKPVNDGGYVEKLREIIIQENKETGSRKYVKLQGRGHRHGVERYNQALPLPKSEYADVYVYERYS